LTLSIRLFVIQTDSNVWFSQSVRSDEKV
jgi:hypothetical protein